MSKSSLPLPARLAAWLALAAFLVILPHFLSFHHQDLVLFLTINVLVVCSYRLVTLTGEWSLIHAVMLGVGAYTATLAFNHLGLEIWFTLPLAGIVAGLVAGLLCFPLLRMTQFYFLIGSFAAGEAIRLVWVEWVSVFGGTSGLRGVEAPIVFGIDFLDPIPYYYFCLVVVGFCLFLLYRIEHSRVGLTLHAIHWKTPLAESVGVDAWRYRALAFILGSFFVGIAGALKIHYLGSVTPNQFTIGFMVFILIWVIVGGYGTFYGPIVGVIVLTVFDEAIRDFEIVRPAIYGGMLILAILFLPKGLESIPQRLKVGFGLGRGGKESALSESKEA
ncbi:MAG: branched-chain amino acid ABC transporter permease [Pseudomonadota bacterium]